MTLQLTPAAKISYTNADWRSLRDELFARIPVLSVGRWTDLNESDLGIAVLELLIAMQDQLLFYLDKKFSETQLPTAVQRANVKNLLKLIDYDLLGYGAAKGQVTLSVSPAASSPTYGTVNGHANSIYIPAGTQLSGRSDNVDSVDFYTTEDAYLTASEPGAPGSVIVGVIQGQKITAPEVFSADGTANQRYVLSIQGIDRNLLIVKIGSSEASSLSWSNVSSFLTSESNDQVFQSSEDARGNVYVQFGDGKFGKIPALGQNIYVYPILTLGSVGNLAAGTITSVSSVITDANGIPVQLIATNILPISGGADPETIENAKQNGPALLSALFRAMSKNDYIALTRSINGVDKANAWGEQEEEHPNVKLINRVMVVFLALDTNGNLVESDSTAYTTIKSNVQTLLEERKPVTTRLVFRAPEWVDIIISAIVAVDRMRYDPEIVAADVKLAVQDYFSYANVEFGQDARQSLVAKLISSVPGVSWATVKLSQSVYTQGIILVGGTNFQPIGSQGGSSDDNDGGIIGTGIYQTVYRWIETIPDYADIPVSRWKLIRINDFDKSNKAILGDAKDGSAIEHVRITTTANIDSPVPDPLPNPCLTLP